MRRGRVVLDVIVDRPKGEVLLLRSGTFLFGEYLKSKRRWIPAKAGMTEKNAANSRSNCSGYVVAQGLVLRRVGANCMEKMDSRFRGKDGKECGQFSWQWQRERRGAGACPPPG